MRTSTLATERKVQNTYIICLRSILRSSGIAGVTLNVVQDKAPQKNTQLENQKILMDVERDSQSMSSQRNERKKTTKNQVATYGTIN